MTELRLSVDLPNGKLGPQLALSFSKRMELYTLGSDVVIHTFGPEMQSVYLPVKGRLQTEVK